MMKNVRLALVACAFLAAAACGKNSDVQKAVDHIGDEGNKKTTEAQLAGRWGSACDQKSILWEVVGVKSSKTIYDFYNNSGKTTQLFSDAACTNLLGIATYTGTAVIGAPSAVDNSNLLDLNYMNVSITIQDQATVDALNNPLNPTPGCGINDWKVNQAREVTSASGALNCPIPKPAQVFDIVKTDGATLHFGKKDASRDKSSQGARPTELDLADGYSKL